MRITKEHRLVKATYYRKAKGNPLVEDPANPSTADIELLTGCTKIELWMQDQEFSNWFLEEDSNKSLIASGCQLAIEKLMHILSLEGEDQVGPKCETTSAAQVKAAETLLRLGGFEPPKAVASKEFADKDVNDMDEKQLKAYIADRSPKIVK